MSRTLSRLPAARALIAGAALLAGGLPAGPLHAAGPAEDTAFANPRVPSAGDGSPGLDGAGLPLPLAPSDAARYRRIFALQDAGKLDEATAELALVSEPLLQGNVLAQRLSGRSARASAADLAGWLARYPDHPDAPALYAALLTRLDRGTAPPPAPAVTSLAPDPRSGAAPEEDDPAATRLPRNAGLDRQMGRLAQAGDADVALRLLARVRGLDRLYGGQLRAEIAQALFAQGRDEAALRTAQEAFRQTGGQTGLAGYVAGLAAWRLDRPDVAQPMFEAASHAAFASASLRAGAAFWAGRAHLRNGEPALYRPWLRQAAEARHTFYGLLARRILGGSPPRPTSRDTLGAADGEALMALPGGRRALALIQVGQIGRAEAELRTLWPAVRGDAALSGAVLRVAEAANLTDLAAQLAGLIETSDGQPHDDARFPMPVLRPAGGFRIDPAMVYALTRLESNFEPNIVSSGGARGLMQLLPLTASYMSGDGGGALALNARRLHDPGTNLALGQTYVQYLAASDVVKGDLIRLLASYNAGTASFARMSSAIPASDDPLLFMESIPNRETRAYVPRALAFTWIYAARLHVPAPSLDELAAGAWPSFHGVAVHRDLFARMH